MSYIYLIKHNDTGNCYVGSTNNKIRRMSEHLRFLRRDRHHSPKLQNAWNKYGENSFSVELLEECDLQVRFDREQSWISKLNSVFNIVKTADGSFRLSQETKEKISLSMKGNSNNKGFKHSKVTKLLLSKLRTQFYQDNPSRGHTESVKSKISEGTTGSKNGRAILDENDVRFVRSAVIDGESVVSLAKKYGVKETTIFHVISRRTWKHI